MTPVVEEPLSDLKLLLATSSAYWAEACARLFKAHRAYPDVLVDSMSTPDCLDVDWLLAFKSDRIWREAQLNQVRGQALNIHLAPPWHRGLGGYERAIHEGWSRYGVTLHVMDRQIDHGPIVKVHYFDIPRNSTTRWLAELAGLHGLLLLSDLLSANFDLTAMEVQGIEWTGELFRRQDLERLTKYNPHLRRH